MHFPRLIDTEFSPRQKGKLAYGRGISIDDCEFDDKENVRMWQEGWRWAMQQYRPVDTCSENHNGQFRI